MPITGAGVSVALNVKQFIEIDRFVGLKSFVGRRNEATFLLNLLFNFEPMEIFET